jgi:hypothetical protein
MPTLINVRRSIAPAATRVIATRTTPRIRITQI